MQELEVVELRMLYLRAGVTIVDKVRNEYTKASWGTRDIKPKIEEKRMGWFRYLVISIANYDHDYSYKKYNRYS